METKKVEIVEIERRMVAAGLWECFKEKAWGKASQLALFYRWGKNKS